MFYLITEVRTLSIVIGCLTRTTKRVCTILSFMTHKYYTLKDIDD